jgi:hypothetical protein
MGKFIPSQQAAVLLKAAQMHAVLSKTGVVPDDYGLTAQDVTELGTLLTTAQAAGGDRDNAAENKRSKTTTFSAGALPDLVGKIRDVGNKVRISDASDDMIQAIGVDRRKATPTRKTAPTEPPEIAVESVLYHRVRLRIHETGNVYARSRPVNASGVQIAVVDAANPAVVGEEDHSPIKSASRSPVQLDTTGWPAKVRLYARWETQRKEFSPWSGPAVVSVL